MISRPNVNIISKAPLPTGTKRRFVLLEPQNGRRPDPPLMRQVGP
jgi:hypothetical protein